MRIGEQDFSARVELPCKMFCGPDSMLEFSGTAVSIDRTTLLLQVRGPLQPWKPSLGEQVKLELQLPSAMTAQPRFLSFRARLAAVEDLPNGTVQLEMRFRKANFREGIGNGNGTSIKAAKGWRM